MKKNTEEMPREETPIHRYYYSLTTMTWEMHQNKRGEEYYKVLYSCIYSYYQESLALLRANRKLMKVIDEQEKEFESSYLVRREKIDKDLNSADENDKDFLTYQTSNLLQMKIHFYEDSALERNLFALGTIVQFLSLMESTLHSIYKNLIQIDKRLPNIHEVCNRDKGIVKYLKYFENVLISKHSPILIGTMNYQKLRQWIDFRNNIVHNNNDVTVALKQAVSQKKLNISETKGKFTFDEDNINDVAEVCGKSLDVFIEQIFKPYFIKTIMIMEQS